jgi:hypothetical protein
MVTRSSVLRWLYWVDMATPYMRCCTCSLRPPIANLTTLNGYIDGGIDNMANSTYYFVGKSRAENTYYWRSLDMAKRAMHPSGDGTSTGKKDTPEASAWSDWQKIPLPASDNIPDRSVRPVFFNNRLFIIWAQVIKPTPSLSEPAHLSDLKFDEDYQQYKARSEPFLKTRFSKISLNFIYQKYDGSWSLPQVCIDEYNTLKVSAEGINAATTTIATLDSTTYPPSLFLGLHIKGVKNGTYQTTTELAQGFYQAVRLDLQFGIKPLYSSGTLQDFFAYPAHRELAKQYGAIFADHNELNFNFHAPISRIVEVERYKNESHNTNSSHWNFENKQEYIKDISNKSDLRFNTTTGALEVKSCLAKDFPKYQKLSFSSNYTPSEVWLELVVDFSNIEQPSVKLQPGSSITFKQQGFAVQYLQNIDIINTRNRQKISILSVSPDKKKFARFLTGDNQATLDLQDLQIDKDIFTQLHSANSEPYSISLNIEFEDIELPKKIVSFDNLTTSAFNRTYKQIIIIPGGCRS